MSTSLMTSAEKAAEMGVGVSSVKRWADEGKLEFVLTPGGHRRFHPGRGPGDAEETGHRPARSRRGNLEAVLQITRRLEQLGERWACGELSVAEEHRESHLIATILDQMRTPPHEGPLCMLACPPGELHDLPLRMVRLVLEWRGWRTDFLGASTPWDALQQAVDSVRPDLVAISSRGPVEVPDLGVPVIVGGPWARGPWGGRPRFRSIVAFDRWLAAEGTSRSPRSDGPESDEAEL